MLRPLIAPAKRPIALAPCHRNADLAALYHRNLDGLIEATHHSIVFWKHAAP
jgi:hypothetical protein